MFLLSDRFTDALRASHTRVVTAELWNANGTKAADTVEIVDGRITGTLADVRTTLDLTIASPDGSLVPVALTDPLAPFGSEIVIRAGIRYADGTTETAPMGRFRITSVRANQDWLMTDKAGWRRGGAIIQVAAQDRMGKVARSGLMFNMSRPPATLVSDDLRMLVGACMPVGFIPTPSPTVGPGVIYDTGEGSRMASIKRIMPSTWDYRVDRGGVFTVYQVQPIPSVNFQVYGGEGGNLIRAEHHWTSENYYNGVVTSAQNASDLNPIKGLAVEGTPPVWWGGGFGYIPLFKTGLPITTQQDLDNAALGYLRDNVHGRYRRVVIDIPPDPRIDIGDGIKVTLPDSSFNGRVCGIHFPLSINGGPMSVELEVAEATYISTGGVGGAP